MKVKLNQVTSWLPRRRDMTRTWLITGSSRGFGHAVAEAALRAGGNVVATARHASQLGGLQDVGADRVRLVTLDVTDAAASRAAAATATSAVGFNQAARTIGVTIGSALCGIILEAATPAGGSIPRDSGYTTAALIGASILLATAVAGVFAVPLAHRACPDTDQVQGSAVNHVPSGTSA
jgi:NAD(P)-dependent dehydrogenase (short-subunit alcohol dehydrogenase family)